MRTLSLREYQTTCGVELSAAEQCALVRIAPSIGVRPSGLGPGLFDLTPGSEIGAIRAGGLSVTIEPKMGISNLMFVLAYGLSRGQWNREEFRFEKSDSIVDAIVPGFLVQLRRVLRRGILHGYRRRCDTLYTMRGRIRFPEQLRRHYGRVPPLEVEYDEFTEDSELNRILKAALLRVVRLQIRSRRWRSEISRSIAAF